jgi:hypothetical protein
LSKDNFDSLKMTNLLIYEKGSGGRIQVGWSRSEVADNSYPTSTFQNSSTARRNMRSSMKTRTPPSKPHKAQTSLHFHNLTSQYERPSSPLHPSPPS